MQSDTSINNWITNLIIKSEQLSSKALEMSIQEGFDFPLCEMNTFDGVSSYLVPRETSKTTSFFGITTMTSLDSIPVVKLKTFI